MSIVSNHYPAVLDELNAREEAEVLAGAPVPPEPTEEEYAAIGNAAGQLLAETVPPWADEILNILPEDPPAAAPCRQVAASTDARQARPKPARSVRLLSRTHGMYELPDIATVEITMTSSGPRIGSRTDTFRYVVEPIPSAFGRGFHVTREDTAEVYAVNLNGRRSSCECRGFLRHGHCKHVDGLQALATLGLL